MNPHAPPERRQRAFNRIERGLRPLGAVEPPPPLVRIPEHRREQGLSALLPEDLVTTLQHLTHDGLALVQLPTHPEPLASLPGVEEGHLRLRRALPVRTSRAVPSERLELFPERRQIPEDDARAACEVAAPDAGRPGHVRERGVTIEPGAIPCRQVAQRTPGLRGERQHAVWAR